jgi:hypothetical protein
MLLRFPVAFAPPDSDPLVSEGRVAALSDNAGRGAYGAPGPTLERFIEKTGLPRDAFRQLLLHAKLDIVHARELQRVLDSLPLQPVTSS